MGGAALSIIGEVQADANFAEKLGNLIPDGSPRSEARSSDFKRLTLKGSVNQSSLWQQIERPAPWHRYPPISPLKGPTKLRLAGLALWRAFASGDSTDPEELCTNRAARP
jgi:hypothetical protein